MRRHEVRKISRMNEISDISAQIAATEEEEKEKYIIR